MPDKMSAIQSNEMKLNQNFKRHSCFGYAQVKLIYFIFYVTGC